MYLKKNYLTTFLLCLIFISFLNGREEEEPRRLSAKKISPYIEISGDFKIYDMIKKNAQIQIKHYMLDESMMRHQIVMTCLLRCVVTGMPLSAITLSGFAGPDYIWWQGVLGLRISSREYCIQVQLLLGPVKKQDDFEDASAFFSTFLLNSEEPRRRFYPSGSAVVPYDFGSMAHGGAGLTIVAENDSNDYNAGTYYD